MDAARQVIRWSIPGTTLLLAFGGFQLLHRWAWGHTTGELLTDPVVQGGGAGKAVLAFATGIPLGFLVYQWYYATYGRVILGRITYRDRGTEILRHLPEDATERLAKAVGMREVDLESLVEEGRLLGRMRVLRLHDVPRSERHALRQRYRDREKANWGLVRSCLDLPQLVGDSGELKCEYTMLSDIFHSVGATRIAVLSAFVASTTYTAAFHFERWRTDTGGTLIGTALGVMVLIALLVPLTIARRSSMESLLATLKNGLYCLTTAPSRGSGRSPASPTND